MSSSPLDLHLGLALYLWLFLLHVGSRGDCLSMQGTVMLGGRPHRRHTQSAVRWQLLGAQGQVAWTLSQRPESPSAVPEHCCAPCASQVPWAS